ncbi:MAG: T9SS type A sorting domain-containing protein [Bacteroidia bacterium]
MKYIFLFATFIFLATALWAQEDFTYKQSEIMTAKPMGQVNVAAITDDFRPRLYNLEAPVPGSKSYRAWLMEHKKQIGPKLRSIPSDKTLLDKPEATQLRNFEGNLFNLNDPGAPNDNHIAISNEGKIVSVINKSIYVFDTLGNMLQSVSLHAFSDTLGLSNDKYDPRVIYDPNADKFIIMFLHGRTDSTSLIVSAFSQTNDPSGIWNLYTLPGNPVLDTSWSDFPMMGITEDEVFLTINLLKNGLPWQEAFKQTVIWQINMNSGYNNEELQLKHYTGFRYKGTTLRNVCPVQGGSRPMGPGIYFLNNRNFDLVNDTIFMLRLTGTLDDPNTELTVAALRSDVKYGVPPTADQPNNHYFDTNDGRVLDAYEENGLIHFVANTRDMQTQLASIYHGTITLTPPFRLTGRVLSHPYLEFGYPSIAYMGVGLENEALIAFDHTSDTVNPGNSIIYFKDGEYSDAKRMKDGEVFVNIVSGLYERWGDYTGIQRKYNEPGRAWMAANFGKKRSGGLGFQNINGTWISEISVGDKTEVVNPVANIFPTPSPEFFSVKFQMDENARLSFNIYDIRGRLIETLLNQEVSSGENLFTFSTAPLQIGNYILRIEKNGEEFMTERIVVAR